MTERTQDTGLFALLEAVVSEEISPERLAAYASDPGALDPDDRRQVERAIAASPALADQLRVLQSFDASAISGASTDSEVAPNRVRDARMRPPRRQSRWLTGWTPAIAAAAAAVVVAAVVVGIRDQSERVAALEAELQGARDRVASLESELTRARGLIARQERGSDIRTLEIEEELVAGPDPLALEDPLQVATISVYDVPDPGVPIVRSTSQSQIPGDEVPEALAPARAGWTLEAQPTLYWYAASRSNLRARFALTRERDRELIKEHVLDTPHQPGIQRIELSQLGVLLEEGESYQWTVSFADPARPSHVILATGGIRRVAPPESIRSLAADTSGPQRLDALERAGIWYDAFDLLSRWIDQYPDASNLIARRSAMLTRVGIALD